MHLKCFINNILKVVVGVAGLALSFSSCRKFLTIEPPAGSPVKETVFKDANTAAAALQNAYGAFNYLYNGQLISISVPVFNALYPDEYTLTTTHLTIRKYYSLSLDAGEGGFWKQAYSAIFQANAILEGLEEYGTSIKKDLKDQIAGETKFLRAYTNFLLVNLYGDVPLLLTADYERNRLAPRSSVEQVYSQILKDLLESRDLMKSDYLDWYNAKASTRLRATREAADALLSRVYLYRGEWAKAETHATEVISKTELYTLEPVPANALNVNSKETILALDHLLISPTSFPLANWFVLTSNPNNSTSTSNIGVVSDTLLNSFEAGDNRKRDWIGTFSTAGNSFYYSNKFRMTTSLQQFISVIRLAEMYLIRAEARLEQDKRQLAIDDLNVVRNRARAAATAAEPNPLPALSSTLSPSQIRLAMEKERFTELFTEGHRWFDLKRWKGLNNPAVSRADEAMPAIAAKKGSTWSPDFKLLPIPQRELEMNKNLVPNPGY